MRRGQDGGPITGRAEQLLERELERFERGVAETIEREQLPWHVTRLGCRVEYLFRPERPRTGSDAASGTDHLLDRLIHLWAIREGRAREDEGIGTGTSRPPTAGRPLGGDRCRKRRPRC